MAFSAGLCRPAHRTLRIRYADLIDSDLGTRYPGGLVPVGGRCLTSSPGAGGFGWVKFGQRLPAPPPSDVAVLASRCLGSALGTCAVYGAHARSEIDVNVFTLDWRAGTMPSDLRAGVVAPTLTSRF